jgi:rhodanese-related sulfurtransferase
MTVSDMKIYYIILLSLFIGNVSAEAQTADTIKFKSLPPVEFQAALKQSEKPVIIDVREFFEYKKSRLKDAINLPSSGNLESASDTIDKKSDLFFYCTSGFRSKRVAKFFSERGFTHLYSLDGGIMGWRKAKLPVVKKKVKR